MSNEARPRAAIACRISKAKDKKDRLGVQRQERECHKLAKALEVDVVAVYVDNNRSAYSGVDRPDYDALVRAIEDGEVDVVLAWHPDRLHRNVEEHEAWIKLIRRTRVRVVTLQGGERDLTKASDRMVARVVAATSAYESELKAERQISKIREQAEAGKPNNGPRPFGWTTCHREKLVAKEAKALRGAVERLLAGASQMDAVRWLNDTAKTPPARGGRWTVSKLRKVLTSPSVAGLREVKDEDGLVVDIVTGRWKRILSTDEHDRIKAILANVRRHRAPSVYLLSGGLLVCGRCGTPMVGAGKRDQRRYRCPQQATMTPRGVDGCGRIGHIADTLEPYVVNFALGFATDPDVIASRRAERQKVATEAEQVRDALHTLDLKEQRLTDLAVDGDLSPREQRRKMAELRTEREQHERRLSRVQSAEDRIVGSSGIEEARRRWEGLTFNEQRAVLRSLLVEVRLKPGLPGRNVFDADRITIRPDWAPALAKAQEADPDAEYVDVAPIEERLLEPAD